MEKADQILSAMVYSVNKNPTAYRPGFAQLTVLANGQLICGWLIGVTEYFELLGKEWARQYGDVEERDHWRDFWSDFAPDPIEFADAVEPTALHLRDVRILSSVGGPPLSNRAIRLRLSDISGFLIGWPSSAAIVGDPIPKG